MPITKSVKKSLRQSERKNKRNNAFKLKMKKIIKSFLTKPSQNGLKEVYSILDKAAKKNIYHKNKVNRLKSELNKKVKKPTEKKSGSKMSKTKSK